MIPINRVARRLLRYRVLQRRLATTKDTACYEVFTVSGNSAVYHHASTLKTAMDLADSVAKQTGGTVSVWSPLRGHVYQVTSLLDDDVVVLHGRTGQHRTPEDVVDGLVVYINGRSDLSATLDSIEHNMFDLANQGKYDSSTAVAAFMSVAEAAINYYTEQYGGTQHEQYPHDIRRLLAERLEALFGQKLRERSEETDNRLSANPPIVRVTPDDQNGQSITVNVHIGEKHD